MLKLLGQSCEYTTKEPGKQDIFYSASNVLDNKRYIYEMYYKKHEISKELYEFCLRNKLADAGLIAKWKKVRCLECLYFYCTSLAMNVFVVCNAFLKVITTSRPLAFAEFQRANLLLARLWNV